MGNAFWVIFMSAMCGLASASKILVLVPTPARSHHNLMEKLSLDLVKRGHQVTFITAFPQPKPVKNLEEIIYPNFYNDLMSVFLKNESSFDMLAKQRDPVVAFLSVTGMGLKLSDTFLSLNVIQQFLRSKRTYDLVLGEAFFIESVLGGLVKKYDAPLITLSTSMPSVFNSYMVGNPAPSACVPSYMLDYTDRMTFMQRVYNTVYETIASIYFHMVYLPQQDSLMRKHFGNHLPPVQKIMTNTSLVLVNHHYSLSFPRPYLPNMIEIGGYHVNPLKPLPNDLKKYMDESSQGVILFSLGSHLKSMQLPKKRLQVLLKAFSRLKVNVLWKFEDDSLENVPKNVKTVKWLPQSDLLAHPNLKLFMTHGGLLSITEAVMRGVPLLGFPIFGDQPANMAQVEAIGFGRKLSIFDVTEDVLYDTIVEMLNNPGYKEKAKQRSVLLQDIPMPAADTAVYWVEYVIRHGGAYHLRSASVDLEWYQLYLVDVISVFVVIGLTGSWLFYRIVRLCCCRCGGKKEEKQKLEKKKKKKTN